MILPWCAPRAVVQASSVRQTMVSLSRANSRRSHFVEYLGPSIIPARYFPHWSDAAAKIEPVRVPRLNLDRNRSILHDRDNVDPITGQQLHLGIRGFGDAAPCGLSSGCARPSASKPSVVGAFSALPWRAPSFSLPSGSSSEAGMAAVVDLPIEVVDQCAGIRKPAQPPPRISKSASDHPCGRSRRRSQRLSG